jgi:hypothetical protein
MRPVRPMVTEFCDKSMRPSTRPRTVRSSSPETSPTMVIDWPMIARSRGAAGAAATGGAGAGAATTGAGGAGCGWAGAAGSSFFHIVRPPR